MSSDLENAVREKYGAIAQSVSRKAARAFLSDAGVDVNALAPQVNDRFASAFVRARKPDSVPAVGPESCQ